MTTPWRAFFDALELDSPLYCAQASVYVDSLGQVVELKRAADLAPSSDDAHRRLGRAYLSSGKPKEAIAAYEKAVLINPYRWVNSAQLGIAHAQLADYDEAVKAFRRVTELAPENAAGFNDLGAVLLQAGRPA